MLNFQQLGKSFYYAWRGLCYTWEREQNFKIQIICALLVVIVALILKIGIIGISLLLLVIALVLVLELVNTAAERFSDALKPRLTPYVEVIKDLMAAAVFIASLVALIIGLLLFGPEILKSIYLLV